MECRIIENCKTEESFANFSVENILTNLCREASTRCVALMMVTPQAERMGVYVCGIRTLNQSPEWTSLNLRKAIKVMVY